MKSTKEAAATNHVPMPQLDFWSCPAWAWRPSEAEKRIVPSSLFQEFPKRPDPPRSTFALLHQSGGTVPESRRAALVAEADADRLRFQQEHKRYCEALVTWQQRLQSVTVTRSPAAELLPAA